LSHLKSMEEHSTLAGENEEQDPTVILWLMYFLANHYYFVRDLDQALQYLNRAIEHTPTVIELYTLKAKVYKRAGDSAYAS
jgi:N-alpha-acetyltransferase 15/16, NatA auxiliary subunit